MKHLSTKSLLFSVFLNFQAKERQNTSELNRISVVNISSLLDLDLNPRILSPDKAIKTIVKAKRFFGIGKDLIDRDRTIVNIFTFIIDLS